MGWTSVPCPEKPKAEDLNKIIEDILRSDRHRIVDRSGWLGWNSRVYVLMEHVPLETPEDRHGRFIAVALMEYRRGELFYKVMTEDEGPNACDCPLRLLEQAGDIPPANDSSVKWRERVRLYHRDRRRWKDLLPELEGGPDRRLKLRSGETVEYRRARHRGKRVAAYLREGDPLLYRLSAGKVDLEATERLRAGN